MKISLRIALVSVAIACFATLPFLNETAANTVRLIESPPAVASTTTPTAFTVTVGVLIDCAKAGSSVAPPGTVASIAATSGDCVGKCTGTGGTATFNSSSKASTTLSVTCKTEPSDMVGCEFTAFWQDSSGNTVTRKAKVVPHGRGFTLTFTC
jgi:hypothetical protein